MAASAYCAASGGRASALSAEAIAVWGNCRFRSVAGRHADELLVDAHESVHGDKSELRLAGRSSNRMLALIVNGSARVYTTSVHGRQATVRYVHAGDVLGLATLLAPALLDDGDVIGIQARGSCRLVRLSASRFRAIVERESEVMWRLFGELAQTLMSSHHMLAENVFQPVRSRVARHLLDMADSRDGKVMVFASPQDIADAIGSVREVVSRATIQLRDAGIIRREGTAYVIHDPQVLSGIAAA